MLGTIYLLHFNNYYNRRVIRYNTLEEYQDYIVDGNVADTNGNFPVIQNVNFNPGDYVNTQQVVNWQGSLPDYLLYVEENKIISRWFVIDDVRTREGQHLLSLHRDVLADYYEGVKASNYFIEQAVVKDLNDPAIYNDEGVSFNQIKRGEFLLKDETKSAWIVGYLARNEGKQKVTAQAVFGETADINVTSISDLPYGTLVGQDVNANLRELVYGVQTYAKDVLSYPRGTVTTQSWIYSTMTQGGGYVGDTVRTHVTGGTATGGSINTWEGEEIPVQHQDSLHWNLPGSLGIGGTEYADISQYTRNLFSKYTGSTLTSMNASAPAYFTEINATKAQYDAMIRDNGKVIHVANGDQYFRLKVQVTSSHTVIKQLGTSTGLFITMRDNLNMSPGQSGFGGSAGAGTFGVQGTYDKLTVTLEQLFLTVEGDFSGDRYNLTDAPYDMFCIPFTEGIKVKYLSYNTSTSKTIEITNVSAAAFSVASFLAAELGEKVVYDIQLLPYCPARYAIKSDGTIDATSVKCGTITREKKAADPSSVVDVNGRVPVSIILWATQSSFSVDRIDYTIPQPQTAQERKIQYLTEVYRVCSPNYAGIFEFSPAMNGGVDYFKADCTYKPFGPFIRVSPNFHDYYGVEFNDLRGLILGGDFSLPIVSDAWTNYQLENKNYQQMFDRQIQNMEVSHDVAREQEKWQVAAGAIGAFGQGVSTGAMFGPWGMLAGAGAGLLSAGVSTAAGMRDIQLNETLRQESKDFATDMFNMRNQNIQALPMSIAKTSAITINNKIFPFVEKYTATDKEVAALKEKFRLRGMDVNRIDYLSNFVSDSGESYIKARLIRYNSQDELDYQIIAAIAGEMYKGVYM